MIRLRREALSFQLAVLTHKGSAFRYTQKTHKGNWLNSGGREANKCRGKGTGREALLWGETRLSDTRGSHPGQES